MPADFSLTGNRPPALDNEPRPNIFAHQDIAWWGPPLIVPPAPPSNLYLLDTTPQEDGAIYCRFGFDPVPDPALGGYLVKIVPDWASPPVEVSHHISVLPAASEFPVRHLGSGGYRATIQSWIHTPVGRLYSPPSPSLVFRLGDAAALRAIAHLAEQCGVEITEDFTTGGLVVTGGPVAVGNEARILTKTLSLDPPAIRDCLRAVGMQVGASAGALSTALAHAALAVEHAAPAAGRGWWCTTCRAFVEVSDWQAEHGAGALCFTCGNHNTIWQEG